MAENIDEGRAQPVASRQTCEGAYCPCSSPKIQKVSDILRQNPNFAKYCSPKIISFGPIHHRSDNVKVGRYYKSVWTSCYIEEYSREIHACITHASTILQCIIQEKIGELKKFFSDDVLEGYDDCELSCMLFVDGCSLLYYMDKFDRQRPRALGLKHDQLLHTRRDIFLLENQLPMMLLELLSEQKGANLEHLVYKFIEMGSTKKGEEIRVSLQNNRRPTHTILDSCRSVYVDTEDGRTWCQPTHFKIPEEGTCQFWRADSGDAEMTDDDESNTCQVWRADSGDVEMTDDDESNEMTAPDTSQFWGRFKTIRDLKPAGIRVKAFPSSQRWRNISFSSSWFGGELRMPMFLVNDSTLCLICNIIAYEMCPDFPNNLGCCSYFSFMDSLIDDARDVKELRLTGVFENLLGSDEELAKFFNDIGRDLPTQMSSYMKSDVVACSQKYFQIKCEIKDHYRCKWKRCLAEVSYTHFDSSWSIMASIATVIGVILTLIQTIYAVKSYAKS